MDTCAARRAGDESHQVDRVRASSRETAGAHDRFDFATTVAKVRRRIPLSPDPVVLVEADLPPAPARFAEGSSVTLLRVPVEVRLRRDHAPSPQQIDDVLAWLRDRRLPVSATPVPAPPPVAVLQPLVRAEPARRGAVWPLCALSLGLAAAAIAAIIL